MRVYKYMADPEWVQVIEGGKIIAQTRPERVPDGTSIEPYVAPTKAEMDAAENTRDLTPPEFEWLLAYTGLEDIWTGLEQNFKGPDRAKYAFLRGTRKKPLFNLETTLALVAQFRTAAASIDPSVDLSDAAITAAWALATQSGV